MFYDITASSDERVVDKSWVSRVAEVIDIPFCVAGGIKSVEDARQILEFGADKVSINSPALADPTLITRLAERFGVQCVVVGIDSYFDAQSGHYQVKQFTGDESRTRTTAWHTLDWVQEAQKRGAGEIVLNVMNQDACARAMISSSSSWCAPSARCRSSPPAAPVPWSTFAMPSPSPTWTGRWPPPCSTKALSPFPN